jgi:hypothetical protein
MVRPGAEAMERTMKDDGGTAFPVTGEFDERRGEVVQYAASGMTLRDYFAAKAMQSVIVGAMAQG